MAMTHQRQALIRKIAYAGAIVLLFSALVAYRQLGVVERAADRNNVSLANLGELDVGGSVLRYALISLRGPLATLIWWEALDLQARHEFAEMEQRIKFLTKLQPHYVGPWEYQAWNLAFNVSVEFDRPQQKYFHIAQGVNWGADGERINRRRVYDPDSPNQERIVGNPDLRNWVGWIIQQKMTVSDEVKIFRCYLPLSCIRPKEWDPYLFRQNPDELVQFKLRFPQLVRSIRELKRVPYGAEDQLDREMLDFFREVRKSDFPTLYPEEISGGITSDPFGGVGATRLMRFPVWPDHPRYRPDSVEFEDTHHPLEIARNWFEFSIEPLPPPDVDYYKLKGHERLKYRMPTKMVSLIFRAGPPRAKSKQGVLLRQDGWFVESQRAWSDAFEMWREFGFQNRLEPENYDEIRRLADEFAKKYPDIAAQPANPPRFRMEDPEFRRLYNAYTTHVRTLQRQALCHYDYWILASDVNRRSEAIDAYRHVHNATKRFRSDLDIAQREFDLGIEGMKYLMVVPRPIDVRRDASFLLGVGPLPILNVAAGLQPLELFEHTPFGKQRQVQEELIMIEDEYVRLRAKYDSPQWLLATRVTWEWALQLGRQLGCGPALAGGMGCVPTPYAATRLDWVEDFLPYRPGPLDAYFYPDLVATRRGRAFRRPTSEQEQGQPSPGGPGGPISVVPPGR